MKKKEDKLEELYYCFRYKCKRCPKARECEEQVKREEEWKKVKEKDLKESEELQDI